MTLDCAHLRVGEQQAWIAVALRIHALGKGDQKENPENKERDPPGAVVDGTAHQRRPNGVAAVHVCVRLDPTLTTLTWYTPVRDTAFSRTATPLTESAVARVKPAGSIRITRSRPSPLATVEIDCVPAVTFSDWTIEPSGPRAERALVVDCGPVVGVPVEAALSRQNRST